MIIFLLWLLMVVCLIDGYKVLVVFPIPAGSHRNLGDGYVRNLLKAGHEVTYITPFEYEETNPSFRQISVADNVNAIDGKSLNLKALMKHELAMDQDRHFQLSINITKNTLRNEAVQKLLNDPTERFDVVIAEWMFNDIYCGFSAVYDCPYIWSFPYEPNFVSLGLIDEVPNPAYTANIDIGSVPPFNFWQRVYSLWYQITSRLQHHFFYEDIEKESYIDIFTPILRKRGRTLPSYDILRYNASMILGNSHVSLGQAMRLPQNYIPIAGYHIKEELNSIPEELKKILDNAKDGFIYFSLGSNLKSKDFPDKILQDLLKLFGELKETIIWKFEGLLTNKPENVHVLKWAPQQNILAHPNCVLFITHGGMLSVTEAVHYGVPFIGIPVFFDQNINVEQSEKRGIAKKVALTANLAMDLNDSIKAITNDPTYRRTIKEFSFIYHHRPVTPGKELVHWVEHVVLTGGALERRSPAQAVLWHQKMFLDLLALIIALVIMSLYIIKQCFVAINKIKKSKAKRS